MRLRLLVVAAGFAVLTTALHAQSIDSALTAAIVARDNAAIARDSAGVANYTADDYASINPSSQLMNKKQRVDGLKVPAAPGAKPQPPIRTEAVRMYGTGAAVARMRTADSRQLHVWIKNPSGWQVTAIHIVSDVLLPVQAPQDRPKTPQPSTLTAPAGLSGDRAAVFAAQKQIQDAFYSGDRATFEKLTAPEHVRLLPGLIRFSSEGSANIDGPRAQSTYSNNTVQVWDQLGVVRWLETGPSGQTMWLTRVFAKKPAGWQQVATASSVAGKPPIAP